MAALSLIAKARYLAESSAGEECNNYDTLHYTQGILLMLLKSRQYKSYHFYYCMPSGIALICLLFIVACNNHPAQPKHKEETNIARVALHQYFLAHYDSAIQNWNQAFAAYREANQWDSVYAYMEKYIISNSRIYKIKPAHLFLDTIEKHLLTAKPIDSIMLSKLWVRRSELLYAEGNARQSYDTLLAVLAVRKRLLGDSHPLIGDAYDYLNIAAADLGEYWASAGYGERGIAVYKKCRAAGDKANTGNLPWVIGNTGECYNYLGDYDKAIQYLNEAYDSLCTSGAPFESRVFYKIMIAGSYRSKGDYRKAIPLLETCADSIKKTDIKSYLAEVYGALALCYKDLGLYEQMLPYARKQYEIYSEIHKGRNHVELSQSMALLADCLQAAGKGNEADSFTEENLQSYRERGDTATLLYLDCLMQKAVFLRSNKEYDGALGLLANVAEAREKLLGNSNDKVAEVLLEQARATSEINRYAQSEGYALKAKDIFTVSRGANHPLVRECIYLLAEARRHLEKNNSSALQLIDNTLAANDPSPTIDKSFLRLLQLKCILLTPHIESKDTAAWHHCLNAYEAFAKAYQQFISSSFLEGSRYADGETLITHLKNGFYPAYKLLQLTREKKYLQTAFNFSEWARSQSIRLSLQNYNASRFAHVPDSVTKQEELLRISKAHYEKLLLNAATTNVPQEVHERWTDSLMGINSAYARLIERMYQNYPEYYRLKVEDKPPLLAEVNKYAAQKSMSVLSYIVCHDSVFAFLCSKDTTILFPLALSHKRLAANINIYRQALLTSNAVEYGIIASYLYQNLLAPIIPYTNAKDLLIVPDEELHYLSFESLIKQEPKGQPSFKTFDYAIYHHTYKYAYSATAVLKSNGNERKKSGQWMAMAPGFEQDVKEESPKEDDRYGKLLRQPWAKQLAGDMKALFNAASYTGTKATEENYNDCSSSASAIYIGTHAFPNDEDPMKSILVFAHQPGDNNADGYLHAYEIYRSPLVADVVVLGGCETGYGALRGGEGVVSLASGFAYAGCPSLVVSLWPIDDQQTSVLLRGFFSLANEGNTVSEALSMAKKDFLKSPHDDALYNPLYWSGLVSIGSDGKLPPPQKGNNIPAKLAIGAVAALAILPLFFYFRKQRKATSF